MRRYSTVIVALIGLVGMVVVAFLTHWSATGQARAAADRAVEAAKKAEVRASQLKQLSFYQRLKIHLDGGKAGFENQIALRDRLVATLETRYGPSKLEYEPLFAKYYTKMNGEERLLCEQMRGITEILHYHNSEMRGMLTDKDNSEFYGELSEFKDLSEHLDIWISKYNRPFKDQENQCLVYVGVAEKKEFPAAVGEKVQKRLSELRVASRTSDEVTGP